MIKLSEKDQDISMLMVKITELEKIHILNKSEILFLKRNEINRINKEYLTNDYERRYGETQNIIVAAIFGEDNMSAEYSRILREQRVKNKIYLF